jgi:hypothetical protein
MDAQQLNRELDARLSSFGVVDRQIFLQLSDAHGYGAASSVGWVDAKLRVLQTRLRDGLGLELYMPSLKDTSPVTTQEEFTRWVSQHFPDASL